MPRGKAAHLEGQRFGSWTVLSRAGMNRTRQVLWNCRCDCGNETAIVTGNLTTGRSTQCRSCSGRRENNGRYKEERA